MRREENEVCPSLLLTHSPIFLFPNTQSIVYCVLSCLYRVSVKCLDFDNLMVPSNLQATKPDALYNV